VNRPLGCLTGSAMIAATLASLAIFGAATASGNSIFSPGGLNGQADAESIGGVASHADLEQECSACHPAFWTSEVMGDRCLACHAAVEEEIRLETGLHAGFAAPANCRDCHTDHGGAQAVLTRADMQGFPHERTGFVLTAHPTVSDGGVFQCIDCHPGSLQSLDAATCLGCHAVLDLSYSVKHQAAFGTDCLACHDGIDTYGGVFDHGQLTFTLEGRHAEAECILCHRGAQTIDALRAAPTACLDCHAPSDVHEGRLGTDCAECHTPAGWEGAELDHKRTRFSLTGRHLEVECLECHVDRQWVGVGMACTNCHSDDDRHAGQFSVDCSDCHTTAAWSDITFTHTRTGFPLQAAHDVACAECHEAGRYVGTPSTCAGCHADEDAHGGRFGTDCSLCHRPTTWQDATFDHDLASFRLTGAHTRAACTSCHAGGRFAGTPSSCSACHNRPSSHGSSAFGGSCGNCHSTSAWRPASFNGPHPFPQNHGGAGGNCSTCHPSSWFDYSCTGCHEHSASEMQDKHKEVSGFSMGSCVKCHPGGREGDGDD
jgi:hypothetical protein